MRPIEEHLKDVARRTLNDMGLERGVRFLRSNLVLWREEYGEAVYEKMRAALEGSQGIVLDNFSLRGSSGVSLRYIPEQTLKAFSSKRPYDLIILQYGLNVATEKGRNYDYYRIGMNKSIAHIKKCFPEAAILMLGVGDRSYKTEEGELKTMPGVKNLIQYQKVIASESSVAFWNMFQAMGGE